MASAVSDVERRPWVRVPVVAFFIGILQLRQVLVGQRKVMKEETLIVLAALFCGAAIPISWFFFDYRSKARYAKVMEKALEAGGSPSEILPLMRYSKSMPIKSEVPYRKGLVMTAIGASFFLSHAFGLVDNHDDGLPVLGMILGFIGIALLFSDFFSRRKRGQNEE